MSIHSQFVKRSFKNTAHVSRSQRLASRTQSHAPKLRRRPNCEQLENRRLLAADMGWVKPFGDTAFDGSYEVATDAQDNVYVASRFAGSVDLDPDASYPDNRDLVSVPVTAYGLAITKFDSSGNLLWSHVAEGQDGSLSGSQTASPKDIQVEAGSVYVAGSFYDLWDFDPDNASSDSTTHQTGHGAGSFLLKLDAASGAFEWVNGFGLTGPGLADDDSLAVDPLGASYYSMLLREGATIGDQLVPPLPDSGEYRAIVKIADDGQVLGYHQLHSSNYIGTPALEISAASSDPAQWRLYASAGFQGDLSSGGTPIASSPNDRDLFVAELRTDFQLEWIQRYEMPQNQYASFLSTNGSDLYLAGDLGIQASDGTGSGLVGDDFVFRFAQDGTLLASTALGDETAIGVINSIQATDTGVLLGGYFRHTINVGGESLTSLDGTSDAFLAILDSSLTATDVRHYAGTGTDSIRDLTLDSQGAVVVAGTFEEAASLPIAGAVNSSGDDDAFVARIELDGGPEPGNNAPITTSDNYTLPNRLTHVDESEGLLANDFDPDGDVISIELISNVAQGDLQLNQDGSFSYEPNSGYVGPDSFVYRIHDGLLASQPTTVSLEILEEVVFFADSFEVGTWNGKWVEDYQNDWFRSTQRATDGNYSAEVDGKAFDATLTISEPIDLSGVSQAELSFDWLIESSFDSGESLRLEIFDGSSWYPIQSLAGNVSPENVWESINLNLPNKYLIENFSFRFSARASRSNEDANVDNVRLVGLLVNDSNLDPNATQDSYQTNEDTQLLIAAPGVLANDADPEGDALQATVADVPSHGTLTLLNNGSFTYTPDANFSGPDSFTYAVTDAFGGEAIGTVSLEVAPVNDAPIPAADSYALDQDATLNATVGEGLLANDNDVDGDTLTVSIVFGPTSGSLNLNSNGSFTYTPMAGFVGTDSFIYQATDPSGAVSGPAMVTLEVNAVAAGPNLSHGVINNVSSSWQTLSLGNSYNSAVIVATPRYNPGSGPGVVRISNVTATSFDVRVDNVGNTAFSGGVHFIAIEEGVYDVPGQYKLEAVKVDSSTTSGRTNGWQIDSHSYQQSYTNPVVVGQVMSTNDQDWSVFWSSSSSRTSPAKASSLNIGKHVGEDSNATRENETLGYFVIESTQNGTLDGLVFTAGVGADTIRGVGNGTSQYTNLTPAGASTAVLSSAGMDGVDGAWGALIGSNPLPANNDAINLSVDEDQRRDSERKHTTEQIAYFVIGLPAGEGEAVSLAATPPIKIHNPLDVNGDSFLSPIDALAIINTLNSNSTDALRLLEEGDLALDTNGDGHLSPLDALLVINRLNAEAENVSKVSQAIDIYFGDLEDEEEVS